MTILDDHSRRTAQTPVNAANQCILVGGSFTQGWELSDSETFAWRIQQQLPDVAVRNYGTGRYGTCQSLLLMERILPSIKGPAVVVYGFIGHHEDRNVAPADWIGILSEYSHRGHVRLPFATWEDGRGLVRQRPAAYLELPLRTHLATVTAMEKIVMTVTAARRTKQKRRVTQEILMAMKRLCDNHRAGFLVAFLNFPPPKPNDAT